MATNNVEIVTTMFSDQTVQQEQTRQHLQWEDRDSKCSEGTKTAMPEDEDDWESSDDENEVSSGGDDDSNNGPVPEELLNTDPAMGLTDADVRVRQKKYGKNLLSEEKESVWKQILNYFWGPVQFMIEAAAVLSLALKKWIDLGMIVGLLVLNAIVGFLQEGQAGNAIAELKKELALKATVTRNGRREEIEATELTVGDILHLSEGDVVPADSRLIGEGAFLQVDQSSLTGESLAVRKGQNDPLYSSSAIKRGQGTAVVTAIGDMTFIGRAAALVQSTKRVGHFTEVLNKMGLGLIFAAYVSVFIVFISSYFRGADIVDILRYAASLVVVAVPIALPAVITTTLAVGAAKLARKQAIVSRLTAIESLAGVDVLCTDKTGTLTQNKLKVVQPPFIMRGTTTEMLFTVAALSSQRTRKGIDPIDKAVMKTVHRHYKRILPVVNSYRVVEFQPFDPVSKRILVRLEKDGEEYIALKGAPQVVLEHVQQEGTIDQEQADDYNNAVDEFARRGYRSIGVALRHPQKGWELVGIVSLFDPPRYDTKDTIDRAVELGLTVKMLTGDQLAIAKETAQQLGMGQDIHEVSALGLGTGNSSKASKELADFVEKADGFAQVFPEHKHQVVDILQRRGHVVAMTGDGVNDAPSLKKADVGIAVADSANAARSAASIVFMEAGLGVIIDAIKTSRQIFHRMESYMQYRVALSIHVLIYLTGAIVIFGSTPVELTLTVFIAIFSDISVLMIAYDRAPFSQHPVRWNLPRLMFSAVVLGLTLAAGTWVLHGFTLADPQYHGKTSMMAFLEIALTENWVILSTRTGGGFWKFRPGWQLVSTLIIVDIVASIMALYADNFAETIDIVAVVRVWLFSIGVFLVIDFVNMGLNRVNDYRDTSYEDNEEPAPPASKEKKTHWSKDQLRELEDHILVLERVASTRRPDDVERLVPLRSWRAMFGRGRSDAHKANSAYLGTRTISFDRSKSA